MSIFVLNEWVKERCREVSSYSAKKENWYVLNQRNFPGDNPKHIIVSGTIKAVFSWTLIGTGTIVRHLSVSTANRSRLPQPIIVWTLAHYLGFKGCVVNDDKIVMEPSETWSVFPNDEEMFVMVVEPVGPESLDESTSSQELRN